MKQIKKCSLLESLISRGDQIDIIRGELVITPISKLTIPTQWLANNSNNLLNEIAKLYNLNVYIFDSYSTGYYGKYKSAGVTLQFINILTGEQCHTTFNVELKRSRTTPNAKKGSNLPKGQFRVGKKHKFYKFWLKTGLSLPPRLSSFHDYMGNLKRRYFLPYIDGSKSKIIDKMIPLLNITHGDLLARLDDLSTNNNQTINRQQPYISHTDLPYNQLAKAFENRGLHTNITTCSNKYELSKQGSAVTSTPLPYHLALKEQLDSMETDEWLKDME